MNKEPSGATGSKNRVGGSSSGCLKIRRNANSAGVISKRGHAVVICLRGIVVRREQCCALSDSRKCYRWFTKRPDDILPWQTLNCGKSLSCQRKGQSPNSNNGGLVKWLRRSVLSRETRVRVPYPLPQRFSSVLLVRKPSRELPLQVTTLRGHEVKVACGHYKLFRITNLSALSGRKENCQKAGGGEADASDKRESSKGEYKMFPAHLNGCVVQMSRTLGCLPRG